MAALDLLGEPEISEFDEASLVDHDVLRLEVAVDDILGMQIIEGEDDLRDVKLGPACCMKYCSSENFSLMARRL